MLECEVINLGLRFRAKGWLLFLWEVIRQSKLEWITGSDSSCFESLIWDSDFLKFIRFIIAVL